MSKKRFTSVIKRSNGLKVAFISSYPPEECGIAIFTQNLTEAIDTFSFDDPSAVIAVHKNGSGYAYPPEVVFHFSDQDIAQYRAAADFINRSDIDVVCLQHEYGLYAGKEDWAVSKNIFELIAHLNKPLVTVFHTVLTNPPTKRLRKITYDITRLSRKVVTMASVTQKLLMAQYGVAPRKISVIPHGFPNIRQSGNSRYKKLLGFEHEKLILSFGLLSVDKGLEYGIRAIPKIAAQYPEVLYLIVGQTHPKKLPFEGESYRNGLIELVKELGVEKHVRFVNEYLPFAEMIKYFMACDVNLTPYLNPQQMASGNLAAATGCGRVSISTPYWYATEVLEDNRGILVDFKNSDDIADAALELFADPERHREMEKAVYLYSRHMTWPNVALQYAQLFTQVAKSHSASLQPALF